MAKKLDSPYNAALGGGGFLFTETDVLLPLLEAPDAASLLKDEVTYNNLLHMNAERTRSKAVLEIKRRYHTMSPAFWEAYQDMCEEDRKAALLYVIMKTYKIVFDFHINVTMKKWNSVSKRIELADFMMEFDEISARDEFVDSWTDNTKQKIASTYITILRKAGMCDEKGNLSQLKLENPEFYLNGLGEPWFLDAALMPKYQIDNLKQQFV